MRVYHEDGDDLLDAETTSFLTAMRESIESKIDSSARESRNAVYRVEQTLSQLSREVGETITAVNDHKAEDEKVHSKLAKEIYTAQRDGRSRLEKAMPTATTATASGIIIGILEWFRSSGTS